VLSDLPGFDDDEDDNGAATAEIISLMGAGPSPMVDTPDVEADSDGDDAPLALADLDLGDIDDTDLGAIDLEDGDKPSS
jgi:hypothetical protein